MGKVYDALRRAEEQRGRQAVGPAAPAADWPSPSQPIRAPARKPRLFERWLQRGAASEDPNAVNKRRIALLSPDSFASEQFRTLRARIESLSAQRPMRTISVTSAVAGEGKTTTACNLALVLSMTPHRRVVIVDCDMRRAKLQRALAVRPEVGIAEILAGEGDLDKALVRVEGTNLDALVVRAVPPNPAELLASPRMRSLLEELGRRYDAIVLDTPATLGLPDARTVSEIADAVILVVRADSTPEDDVQSALDVLERKRVVGVVLNDAEMDENYYGY